MKKSWIFLLFLLLSIFIVPQSYALSSCAVTFHDLDTSNQSLVNATGCLNQQYCVVRGNDGYLNASTPVSRQEAIALIARYHVEVLHDWTLSTNPNSYWTDFPRTDDTIFFPVQTAKENSFIQGYDNGNGTRSLDPTAPWLFGFHGVNKTDNFRGTYDFQNPGASINRGDFMTAMFSYGKDPSRNQLNACNVYQCGGSNTCSDFYGCAATGVYTSSTSDCKTPIQDPKYSPNQACGYKGKGDDSMCIAPQHDPIGYFDAADVNGLKGWACDIDALSTALHVDFYVDGPAGQGTQIDGAFTTIDRPDTGSMCKDAAGNPTTKHGFLLPLSSIPAQFQDGRPHQIYAYALNQGGGTTNPQLGLSPRTFTYAPATPTPTFTPTPTPKPVDGTTCNDISGANGYVKLVYTPTATGTYTVWTRMIGASANSSVTIQIGNQCNVVVGGAGINTSNWQWVNYRDGNSASKFTVSLTAGTNYTIHVGGRDSGVKVDLVKLDNTGCAMLEGADGHCAPVNQPTPTNTPVPPTATPKPPTNTPIPTSTPAPNSTLLEANVTLHAIGSGGDNANPTGGGGNPNPQHPQRDLTFQIYDTNTNKLVVTKVGKISFNSAGSFSSVGRVDLGTQFPSGSYTVLLKTPGYLVRRIPSAQKITSGQINSLTPITLVTGDIDNNNRLSILDYKILSDCYGDFTTPDPAKCSPAQKAAADINDDGKVNQFDLNYFIRELSVQSGGDEPDSSQ
jgi:hypothetical protein